MNPGLIIFIAIGAVLAYILVLFVILYSIGDFHHSKLTFNISSA